MEPGWIYVLVNSSMPDLVKVGRTTRPPAERVAELSRATGVATPFVLAFEQHVGDCALAERAVHAALDRQGLRAAPNREFFRGSAGDIIRMVLSVTGEYGGLHQEACAAALSGSALLAAGDRHLYGDGDTLQDVEEALRHYQLAARHGSLLAYERLGAVYNIAYAQQRISRRRVLAVLREGARLGNYYCYTEIASLYATERHAQNFLKAWTQFFRLRDAGLRPELEGDVTRYRRALCQYVTGCMELGTVPVHEAALRAEAAALIAMLAGSLEALGSNKGRRVTQAALAWLRRLTAERVPWMPRDLRSFFRPRPRTVPA